VTAAGSAGVADSEIAGLLAAARRDDQTAWDRLVGRFNRLLWAIARGFRLDEAAAADSVQVTWLRLVENLDRIDEPERLGSWLATTMRRECLWQLRRASRERPSATVEWLDAVPDEAQPLDAHLLDNERDAALWRAFGMITDRCQQLLRVLMATPPPTYAEVSAALNMPIGSIGPIRQRCLDQLRRTAFADELLGDEVLGRADDRH
jgi:RNA polymerase sigma factor (sigma-70 family)